MKNRRYRPRLRTDYHICPRCGASLDSGERCDCEYVSDALKAPRIVFNDKKAELTV